MLRDLGEGYIPIIHSTETFLKYTRIMNFKHVLLLYPPPLPFFLPFPDSTFHVLRHYSSAFISIYVILSIYIKPRIQISTNMMFLYLWAWFNMVNSILSHCTYFPTCDILFTTCSIWLNHHCMCVYIHATLPLSVPLLADNEVGSIT